MRAEWCPLGSNVNNFLAKGRRKRIVKLHGIHSEVASIAKGNSDFYLDSENIYDQPL